MENMTVKDLKEILNECPDDMPVIDEDDANHIYGFRHVRTAGDILVVKCNMFASQKQLQDILEHLEAQKEAGVVLLPHYLEAQIVPDDIKIKLIDKNGKEI